MAATREGNLVGEVALSDAGVSVGSKSVAWDNVLYVVTGLAVKPSASPQAVRFKNGETWCVEISAVSGGKLTLGAGVLGKREVALDAVAALDLGRTAAPLGGQKSGTLYKDKGEPLPGKLMWIDERRLAIDSPLGVLTLQRDSGLNRYVLATDVAALKGDVITLVDGSVLCGAAKLSAGGIEIEHAALGKHAVALANIVSIARHPAWAAYLTEMEMTAKCVPLVARAVGPQRLEGAEGGGTFFKAIRMCPLTEARFKPPAGAGKATLRATVLPIPGAKGDAVVRISAGGKTVFEQEIAAGATGKELAVELPAGAVEELTITVDYGGKLAFPSGVILQDPYLVWMPPTSQP
jgi:hypothetical protein